MELSNDIEASLRHMNSYFNEKVCDSFEEMKPMSVEFPVFFEHRKRRDSEISETERSRSDNWPERVLKHSNKDTILNPLLRTSHNSKVSLISHSGSLSRETFDKTIVER